MKKILFLTAAFLLSSVCLFAQKDIVIEHDYASFDAVEALDYYEIDIVLTDQYSVKIAADTSIEDYILAYVKDGTLHLSVDEKGMPADTKKAFKARSTALSIPKATVYVPDLKALTINGTSTVNCSSTLALDTLSVNLGKTGIVKNLVLDADVVDVTLSQKAQAYMTVDAVSLSVSANQNSRAEIVADVEKLSAGAINYANVKLYGVAKTLSLTSEGNSKITFDTRKL